MEFGAASELQNLGEYEVGSERNARGQPGFVLDTAVYGQTLEMNERIPLICISMVEFNHIPGYTIVRMRERGVREAVARIPCVVRWDAENRFFQSTDGFSKRVG